MKSKTNQPDRFRSNTGVIKLLIVFTFLTIAFVVTTRNFTPAIVSRASQLTLGGQADVGADCRKCHLEIVEAYASNIHGKAGRFIEGRRATNCDSCHGSPEKHVRSGKKEDIQNPPKMTSKEANSSCLQCHSQDKHTFAFQGSKHDRKDMSCLSCHSEHHPKSEKNMLTRFTVEDTCLSCHTSVRKAVFQRSTHLFRSEHGNMKVGCTSCHNPHGGEGDKMLVASTTNNTCYGCHADKRGPFLWEHPPARENCMSCHSPHGSSNAKLLTARSSMSCQQCHIHMLPRHSTLAGKPLDIWTLNRGCVNCHSQVHGSNHPGGRTFTR
ncbi:MAG: DmsE family decaheme c-type cytochrome [Pyrinomonadaceae bacterium]